jgi:peptide/nickel transport system permease protein
VAYFAILGVIVLLAVLAPLLTPYSPTEGDILSANERPSSAHWFGTDSLGRDIYTLVLYGARVSLIGPAVVLVIATALGVLIAVVAAWNGGRVDTLLSRFSDILMSCPSLLLAVLAVAIVGTGPVGPLVALSIAYAPFMARAVRSVAVRERSLPYIEACDGAGFSAWRTTGRHLLPNLRTLVVSQSAFLYGAAMVDLAALSFIGLGVQPPQTEWGLLMAQSRTALLDGQPLGTFVPGALIVLVVITVNLIGSTYVKDSHR